LALISFTALSMAEPRYGGMFVPREVEVVDPKDLLEKGCEASCGKALETYQACAARIEEKGSGECSGWYGDYVHCVDSCVSKTLFKKLA